MNDELELQNIEALQKFLTAIQLLGEVYNTDTPFTDSLLPVVTEAFLTQCGTILDDINNKLNGLV